jgi:hypothetical protein
MPVAPASHGPAAIARAAARAAALAASTLMLALALAPVLVLGLVLAGTPGAARAQAPRPEAPRGAVALLPLDAGPRLEIYGQAVATEIARALTAGGVEVVVVGANMDVPAGARLIVDGTLANEKGVVSLSMRVRNPIDSTVLETLSATAFGLAQIDKAAADLSARVLPVVRARLAALADRPAGDGPRGLPPPNGAQTRPLLVGITAGSRAEPLRAALAEAAPRWTLAARREARLVDARTLAGKLAPRAVATTNAERAVELLVLDYSVRSLASARDVPLARARVRVRISDASAVLFDRVVATDTIVGERSMAPAELAARAAAEVLAILRPHVRRAVPRWP